MSRKDAEGEARARFGDRRLVEDQLQHIDHGVARRAAWREAMQAWGRELRLGIRALRRHPGFAIAAVLTLGIGMGAVGSIYTLIQRVVLSPLPYPEPERLVRLKNPVPGVEKGQEWDLSPAQYFYYRSQVPELAEVGTYRIGGGNLTAGGEPRRVQTVGVTASMMGLVGARAIRGRLLTAEDDQPGAPTVVMLSYGLWRTMFGGQDSIIGKGLRVNDEIMTVIGVMDRGVEVPRDRGEAFAPRADLWLTLRMNPAGPFGNNHAWATIARLAPGATPAQVEGQFDRLQPRLIEQFPNAYTQAFFDRYGFHTIALSLKGYVLGDMARNLWILFAAVGLVLLIACANVANLLLVRLETRRRELAIRSAIGARRSDVARAALAEGAVLSGAGLVVGLLLVFGSTRWLVALAPPGIPRLEEVSAGPAVLFFMVGLAVLVAAMLALAPAAQMRRVSGAGLGALTEGGRSATTGRARVRVRGVLVAVQVALAVMLVVGAGLLLRGFARLRSIDPGMAPDGVLTVEWFLPDQRYDSLSKDWRFHDDVLTRIRAMPGVIAAGASEELPMLTGFGCTVQGFEEPIVYERIKAAGLTTCAGQSPTTAGYFEALRIPLIAGRYLTDDDNLAPERGAVVVTKAFAERFWPGENPIGKGVNPSGRSNAAVLPRRGSGCRSAGDRARRAARDGDLLSDRRDAGRGALVSRQHARGDPVRPGRSTHPVAAGAPGGQRGRSHHPARQRRTDDPGGEPLDGAHHLHDAPAGDRGRRGAAPRGDRIVRIDRVPGGAAGQRDRSADGAGGGAPAGRGPGRGWGVAAGRGGRPGRRVRRARHRPGPG